MFHYYTLSSIMPTKTVKATAAKLPKATAPKAAVKQASAPKASVKKTPTKEVTVEEAKTVKAKVSVRVNAPPQATVSKAVSAKDSSSKIEKIKADFASLTPGEQRVLLTEWSQSVKATENPITALVELVQKTFGANLTTEIWTEGASHVPVVYCKLIMPNGMEYTASGKNQKIAKLLAAEEALADLQKPDIVF